MPVVARGRATDHRAFRVEQGLVAERVGVRDAMHFERDEPVRHALRQLPLERLLADEVAFVQRTKRSRLASSGVFSRVRSLPHMR